MLDHIAAIRSEVEAFYDTAEKADPDARVPGCPEWAVKDLVAHLAEVHYFWTMIVERGLTDPQQFNELEDHLPTPDTHEAYIAFGREIADRMATSLAAADQSARVWTWARDKTVGFITRHQVQESAIHRWDIQSATPDEPAPISPDVADDCIDEYLRVTLPSQENWKPPSDTMHIHCTDTGRDWFIEPSGNIEDRPGSADVTLSATASELLLALYRRVPLDSVDSLLGDLSLT